jgi:chromosome segregation ATPase
MESFRRSVPSDKKLRPVLADKRNMVVGDNDGDLPLRKEKEELLRLSAENQRLKLVITEWLSQFSPGDGQKDQNDLLMKLLDENAHLKKSHNENISSHRDAQNVKYAEQFAEQRAQVEELTRKIHEQNNALSRLRQDIESRDTIIREHQRNVEELQALLKLERENKEELADEENEDLRHRIRRLEEELERKNTETHELQDAKSRIEKEAMAHFDRLGAEARKLQEQNVQLEARLQKDKENSVPQTHLMSMESQFKKDLDERLRSQRHEFQQAERHLQDELRQLKDSLVTAQGRSTSLEAQLLEKEQQLRVAQESLSSRTTVSTCL